MRCEKCEYRKIISVGMDSKGREKEIKLDAINVPAIWGFIFVSIAVGLGILECFLYCAVNYTSKKQYQKYLDNFQERKDD